MNIYKQSLKAKGFTLIELLVVIGILGILAAGLLAAIDPLEQLKKGRDTSKTQIAVEYIQALTRYYSVNGQFPWAAATVSPDALSSFEGTHTKTLVDLGELKPQFNRGLPTGAAANELKLMGTATEAYVCFDPESKAISAGAGTIYTSLGTTPTAGAVGSCTATSVCYYCAR